MDIRIAVLGDTADFETAMDQVVDSAGETTSAIEDAAESARSFDDGLSGVGDGAGTLASMSRKLGGALGHLGDTIGGPFGSALGMVGDGFRTASDAGRLLNVAVEGGGKLWTQASGMLSALTKAETYSTLAKQASAAAQWALNAAMSANPIVIIVLAIAALVAGLIWFFTQTEVGREAWGKFTKFLTEAWDKFAKWIGDMWPRVVGFFTVAGSIIKTTWDNIAKWFSELPGRIESFFKDLPGALISTGAQLIMGLWNGINDKVAWIRAKIASFVGDVTKWFKDFFGIASPSKLTHEDGGNLVKGLAGGIDDNAYRAIAAMRRLSAGVQAAFDPSLSVDASTSSGRRTQGKTVVNININGAIDPRETARQIRTLLTTDARLRNVLTINGTVLA